MRNSAWPAFTSLPSLNSRCCTMPAARARTCATREASSRPGSSVTSPTSQVRRVFDVATHKVEYTHDMASVQQRHLAARNACVVDFEKALRLAARRGHVKLPVPGNVAAQGLHALISGLIQNWLLDPEAFELVATGRRTFRVYLAGLGFVRPAAGAPMEREPETLSA
jgi:TetR/AcrR family acrAB operon transcriptional repressor